LNGSAIRIKKKKLLPLQTNLDLRKILVTPKIFLISNSRNTFRSFPEKGKYGFFLEKLKKSKISSKNSQKLRIFPPV